MEPRQPKTPGTFDEDFESVRSAWSGLPREGPPELVDLAVLNSARRQLSASSWRRGYRWMGALATAAVVVLAVNLVVQQEPRAPAPPSAPTDGLRMDRAETRPALPEPRSEGTADRAQSRESAEAAGAPPPLRQAAPAAEQPLADEPGEPAERERLAAEESPGSPAGALSAKKGPGALPDPDEWIERLLTLKEAGQEEVLLRELAEFRAAYPDYPLPPELAGL